MNKSLNIIVDTTCFDDYKSMIELVIINMFAEINEKLSRGDEISREDKNAILIMFQVVHEDCKCIKKININEDERSYEGSIQELVNLASASGIMSHFEKLIKQYVNVFGKSGEILKITICNFEDSKYKDKLKYQLKKYFDNELIELKWK